MIKCGVIDSGKGGRYIGSVLQEKFGFEIVIYTHIFFRSYSGLSITELQHEVDKHVTHFTKEKVDIIVIGCMTLSTNLKEYVEEVSNVPVYDLYSSLPTLDSYTLVIATENTIKSGKFKEYLTLPCPDLASVIENGYTSLIPGLLRGYEMGLKYVTSFNKVILGCSHYPIYKDIFKEYYQGIDIIDPVDYLLERLNEEINVMDNSFVCSGG